MTVRIDADLPIGAHTFAEKFERFETRSAGRSFLRLRVGDTRGRR